MHGAYAAGKPDPFPLDLAISQMNEAAHAPPVRPHEAIYIGDTGDDMRVRLAQQQHSTVSDMIH